MRRRISCLTSSRPATSPKVTAASSRSSRRVIGGGFAALELDLVLPPRRVISERDDFGGRGRGISARPDAEKALQFAVAHGWVLRDGQTVKCHGLLVAAEAVQGAGAHRPVLGLLGAPGQALGQLEIPRIEAKLAGLAANGRKAIV